MVHTQPKFWTLLPSVFHSWCTDLSVLTMHPHAYAILLWLMTTHSFCLSHQGSQSTAHRLRKAWRKEREEKKSFFPSHWGQTQEQVVLGGSLLGMTGSYCLSRGGFWACDGMARGLGERVGEKFELLLNYVTTAEIVTKRHFDNYMGPELDIASPWWLHVIWDINHNKSTLWHVSVVSQPKRISVQEDKNLMIKEG